ncbi:uncharacterized protein MEPE_02140 [Melanopsichium pennsylvanicum]|uniref:Ankyrin repeat protein n=2 Tax=Melanopsichium pennsylvanicum TaxID=63383 RepID=A0AAJ4XJU6_9BASI|nr:ankyrin repeat protein [Melanopsichium pennsylvanicum 4]SNX83433.1 uncharacterized protein MEPE_02140 [Melanopsichium pennsylvanicum]
MSADRDQFIGEAEVKQKLEVPRFSSYQPIKSGSSSTRQEHTHAHVSSHSRKRRRHRKSSSDPKTGDSASKRSRSRREEQGKESHPRHSESSRGHHTHANSESSHRSHRHRYRSSKASANGSPLHSSSTRTASAFPSTEDLAPPTFDRDLFFTDTRGDHDSLLYGQDRSKLPKVHRARRQIAIGALNHGTSLKVTSTTPLELPNTQAEPTPTTQTVMSPAEEFIGIGISSPSYFPSADTDPFSPSSPYVERDQHFEQVGHDPPQAPTSSFSKPYTPFATGSESRKQSSTLILDIEVSELPTLTLLSRASKQQGSVGLWSLPVEVLHRILVLSRSSSLPRVSRFFRGACIGASISDKADFVLGRWIDYILPLLTRHEFCRHVCEKIKHCARGYALRLVSLWSQALLWSELADKITSIAHEVALEVYLSGSRPDVISYAARLGICTAEVLEKVVFAAGVSGLPEPFLVDTVTRYIPKYPQASLPRPLLPKRLFRRIDCFDYAYALDDAADMQFSDTKAKSGTQQDAANSSQDQLRKRRRRRHGVEKTWQAEEAVGNEDPVQAEESSKETAIVQTNLAGTDHESATFPVWLNSLVRHLEDDATREDPPIEWVESSPQSILDTTTNVEELKKRIGPVPSAKDFELIVLLLSHYGANASSHEGYPLAMAVHRGAYSLVHLLLLFGADPDCKEGLAVKIAIGKGSLKILRLLVSGPSLDFDIMAYLPYLGADTLQKTMVPHVFKLDQLHLRLAIQSKQWEVVDYIWHECQVSPDIACLRLIEKLRQ